MKNYIIDYVADNHYEGEVSEAFYVFRVVPFEDLRQRVKSLKLSNSMKVPIFTTENSLGFQQHRMRINQPFREFRLFMQAEVEVKVNFARTWAFLTPENEQALLADRLFRIDNYYYLLPTPYTTIITEDDHLIPEHDPKASLYEFAISLSKHLHQLLTFEINSTNVHTTAHEVLELKKGVCQDYAHLFLAMARKKGLPCRYVSGYLNQGKNFLGDMAMHAWVEVFIPECGWLGLDPTNDLLIDENYVKVCHGRDYSDCSPLRGVIKYDGNQKVTYVVRVMEQ